MQQQDRLVTIRRALIRADGVSLSLAGGEPGEMDFNEVTITEPVAEHYRLSSERLAETKLSDAVLRAFEPGYQAQPHEITYIDLTDDRFADIRADADSASNVDRHQVWEGDNWDIDFYSIRLSRAGGEDLCLWRKFESKHRMRQTLGSQVLWTSRMDDVEEDILVLDNTVDAVVYGDRVFLINEWRCRSMLDLARRMVDDVERAVERVTGQVPVSNPDDFVRACAAQRPMLSKLNSVTQRDYLDDITMDDVERVAEENDVDVDFTTEDGERKVVFDKGPSKRWAILKLLDDDYLRSQMTERNYEATAKKSLTE